MPRINHIATVLLGAFGDYSAPQSAEYDFLQADVGNMEQTVLTGREIIIARNNDFGPHTITVSSVNDPFNRIKDIVYAIQPAEESIFGPFALTGWRQAGGLLFFQADATQVEFAVIRLP